MIENEWFRLKISNVLRIFWAIRVLIQLLHPQIYIEIQNEALFGAINYLLIKGSDTCITVLAITTFISYLSEYIKKFFQWVLQIDDLDDLNCGVISAILFFMLATQSGLTRLDPENRLIRLFEIICLVCTTLQHQIHDMVNKLLMSLVASLNTSLKRHARALLVCGFLIVFAVTILIYLWSNYLVGPWLLSVIALNIATIIKVLVSLAVYSLLLIDTYYSIIWDKLDDYVFYINSFGNIVEFCIRVFILLISVYNVAFIFGGVVSVFLILTQTYSTIYNARNKWKELTRRSTAIKKIESLSQATSTQLSEFNDVCAICHENMNSARITKCNHYFHGECLRKWFYDNDHCPMCYTISE
ncbi:protein TRC8 homolog [Melanaphis sacchari]|nr:protein TRC8 homolog [Melanaphis sacchari]